MAIFSFFGIESFFAPPRNYVRAAHWKLARYIFLCSSAQLKNFAARDFLPRRIGIVSAPRHSDSTTNFAVGNDHLQSQYRCARCRLPPIIPFRGLPKSRSYCNTRSQPLRSCLGAAHRNTLATLEYHQLTERNPNRQDGYSRSFPMAIQQVSQDCISCD